MHNDGVHGERLDQTVDGPESVAAEHPDALALADTSQKTSSDHREDLVQGNVQRYERPTGMFSIVLSTKSKLPKPDDAEGLPRDARWSQANVVSEFLKLQINLNQLVKCDMTYGNYEP